MIKNNFYILGSINMDLVINSNRMPKQGETISGNNFFTNSGGKGANQAVAISKLGGNAFMIGCVGNAFGDELIKTLNSYNVNTVNVNKVDDVSSGVAVITVVNGDNSIILDKGANSKLTCEQIDKALSTAKKGDYLVCQLEIEQDIVEYGFIKAKQLDLITVLNPTPAVKVSDDILKNCDYFIINQSEAEFFTGIYPNNSQECRECFEILKDKGIKNIVITLGKDGSCANINNKIENEKANIVKVVDTTAAGDTYLGALICCLGCGKDVKTSINFASIASSITVTKKGAQCAIPYLNEVETIIEKLKEKK